MPGNAEQCTAKPATLTDAEASWARHSKTKESQQIGRPFINF
jgi:hypothetical protein